MKKSNEKLGQILIKEKVITKEGLQRALQVQRKEKARLGDTLVNLGLASEKDIAVAMAKQLGIPYVSYNKGLLKAAQGHGLSKLVSEEFARQHNILPIAKHLQSLTVAFVDPLDLMTMDNLKYMTGCGINPLITTKSDLEKAIDEFYGEEHRLGGTVSDSYALGDIKAQKHVADRDISLDDLVTKAEEAPVVKLVDILIVQAIKDRASDVHIEPFKDKINIRYRIDGKLYEAPPPSKNLLPAIVSRIKILSNLDIAEHRLPQDGAFFVKVENKDIDIRVSTMPAVYGEKVVLRILDRSQTLLDLDELGFGSKDLEDFKKVVSRPHGLILVTGPTGSGKTTTLYAALNEVKSPRKNISTVEDPVEYRIEGINQVQIHPKIGLTFSHALRSILRQDPDIIMVGEIRDIETAQICIRASLTGHLVMTTLHTNDAASAISRLMEIGIEPYLISPSLVLVASQRLVRKLCPECKEAYETTPKLRKEFNIKEDLLYRAKGCDSCSHTGYMGRAAIFELIMVDDRLRELISRGAVLGEIRKVLKEMGVRSLKEAGIRKAEAGATSIEEILTMVI